MALSRFTPDLDLYDPEDEEGWVGTWEHDDGSSMYGQGDPEMGRELLAANDAEPVDFEPDAPRLAATAPAPEVLDAGAPRKPFVSPYQQEGAVPAPEPISAAPTRAPAAPAPAAAVTPRAGWEDDVPPQVASALRDQASAAGLNPDILAAIIKHESGWDPSNVNKSTGKHGGLIQFERDKTWPDVAKAAGHPEVTWEQALGMSAEQQIPFVVAYYKDKGLAPESTAGDYYKRTFMPAFAQEGDEFVLGEKGSNETRGGLNMGKVYEQNAGSLDLNKDGKITNGEVRQVGDAKYAAQGRAGAGAPGLRGAAPSALGGVPSTMGGMPASQIQVQGTPLSPDQLRQQQSSIAARYGVQAQAHQQAMDERLRGRQEAMAYVQQTAEQQKADALGAIQKKEQTFNEARTNVQKIVGEEIQKVDPKRALRNMSTGDKVLGAIAVMLSAIGQAAGSMVGMNTGPNMALTVLNKAIDDDIESQKDAIDRGERNKASRLAFWQQRMGNAEAGVEAYRAELKQAAGMMIQARAMGSDIADVKAQGMQFAADLFSQGQAEVDKLTQRENERLTVQYATPKAPTGGAERLLENIRAMKEMEQELKMSGVPDDQIAAYYKANGLARLGGETVPQATARQGVERTAAAAKADVERKADEETSKELQPVSEAEAAWRGVLAKIDAISDHTLVSEKGYKPGGIMAMQTGSWPGFPSVDEQNALDQSLTAATNAQIAALGRASDSDEDRIKHETIGGGDLASLRRGIENQLRKLEQRRTMLSARREGAAERVGAREEEERNGMPTVTGKVYIPGAGPLR